MQSQKFNLKNKWKLLNWSMILFIIQPIKKIRLVSRVYFYAIDDEYTFLDVLTHAEDAFSIFFYWCFVKKKWMKSI